MNPKKTFRESNLAAGWPDFVVSDQFEKAVQAAMWSAESQLGHPPDMGSAAANEWKRQGMRMMIASLINLCEGDEKRQPPTSHKLDHRV